MDTVSDKQKNAIRKKLAELPPGYNSESNCKGCIELFKERPGLVPSKVFRYGVDDGASSLHAIVASVLDDTPCVVETVVRYLRMKIVDHVHATVDNHLETTLKEAHSGGKWEWSISNYFSQMASSAELSEFEIQFLAEEFFRVHVRIHRINSEGHLKLGEDYQGPLPCVEIVLLPDNGTTGEPLYMALRTLVTRSDSQSITHFSQWFRKQGEIEMKTRLKSRLKALETEATGAGGSSAPHTRAPALIDRSPAHGIPFASACGIRQSSGVRNVAPVAANPSFAQAAPSAAPTSASHGSSSEIAKQKSDELDLIGALQDDPRAAFLQLSAFFGEYSEAMQDADIPADLVNSMHDLVERFASTKDLGSAAPTGQAGHKTVENSKKEVKDYSKYSSTRVKELFDVPPHSPSTAIGPVEIFQSLPKWVWDLHGKRTQDFLANPNLPEHALTRELFIRGCVDWSETALLGFINIDHPSEYDYEEFTANEAIEVLKEKAGIADLFAVEDEMDFLDPVIKLTAFVAQLEEKLQDRAAILVVKNSALKIIASIHPFIDEFPRLYKAYWEVRSGGNVTNISLNVNRTGLPLTVAIEKVTANGGDIDNTDVLFGHGELHQDAHESSCRVLKHTGDRGALLVNAPVGVAGSGLDPVCVKIATGPKNEFQKKRVILCGGCVVFGTISTPSGLLVSHGPAHEPDTDTLVVDVDKLYSEWPAYETVKDACEAIIQQMKILVETKVPKHISGYPVDQSLANWPFAPTAAQSGFNTHCVEDANIAKLRLVINSLIPDNIAAADKAVLQDFLFDRRLALSLGEATTIACLFKETAGSYCAKVDSFYAELVETKLRVLIAIFRSNNTAKLCRLMPWIIEACVKSNFFGEDAATKEGLENKLQELIGVATEDNAYESFTDALISMIAVWLCRSCKEIKPIAEFDFGARQTCDACSKEMIARKQSKRSNNYNYYLHGGGNSPPGVRSGEDDSLQPLAKKRKTEKARKKKVERNWWKEIVDLEPHPGPDVIKKFVNEITEQIGGLRKMDTLSARLNPEPAEEVSRGSEVNARRNFEKLKEFKHLFCPTRRKEQAWEWVNYMPKLRQLLGNLGSKNFIVSFTPKQSKGLGPQFAVSNILKDILDHFSDIRGLGAARLCPAVLGIAERELKMAEDDKKNLMNALGRYYIPFSADYPNSPEGRKQRLSLVHRTCLNQLLVCRVLRDIVQLPPLPDIKPEIRIEITNEAAGADERHEKANIWIENALAMVPSGSGGASSSGGSKMLLLREEMEVLLTKKIEQNKP